MKTPEPVSDLPPCGFTQPQAHYILWYTLNIKTGHKLTQPGTVFVLLKQQYTFVVGLFSAV